MINRDRIISLIKSELFLQDTEDEIEIIKMKLSELVRSEVDFRLKQIKGEC